MEVFLIKAAQLLLCFAILVLLHEAGHFFFAKLFKIRVEKFCLFFDPGFTLFKFKPKHSDTTYCIGWLPLGGYVKIAGMIDESMDTEQMKRPPQPWEFRAKPAWQRFFVMIGGVLVNFLLALFIYSMVLFHWGDSYIPVRHMTHGFKFNTTAQQYGFRDGDILIATNKGDVVRFDRKSLDHVYRDLSEATSATVLRGGKEVTLSLPGNLSLLDMLKEDPPFISLLAPSLVDSVIPGSPAAKAGLRAGDQVVMFNNQAMTTWNEYAEITGRMNDILISGNPADSARLRHAVIAFRHAGSAKVDTVAVEMTSQMQMGFFMANPLADYKVETKHYGFFESFPAGVAYGWQKLSGYVSDLQYLFTSDGAKSIGSFGAIGSMFPAEWQWNRFWELTAFISLILAFMNILPIPALDGGHVLFLLYEIIFRRKPSENFMEKAQIVGMSLLLLLMLYAVFNDAVRFLF